VAVERFGSREGQDVGRAIFAAKLAVEAADVLVAGEQDGDVSIEAGSYRCLAHKRGERPLPQSAAESDLYRGVDDDHGRVRPGLKK
jgi:hypothetical protein